MLTPEYIQNITNSAEELTSELHIRIVKKIIERILVRFERGDDYILTAVDKWQLETLHQAGFLLEDIQKEIAKATPHTLKEIQHAFEDAGVEALSYDDAVYQTAGLSPMPLKKSPHMIRLMQRAYNKTAGEFRNLCGTFANAAHQTFVKECDAAYNLVTSGAVSYTEAYRDAIKNIAKDGVHIDYPSGHRDTIETATLRCIRTGVSQATADITNARLDEMDWDIVLVSSHFGARYGDGGNNYTNHAWWQGKFYSRSGKDKRFPPFSVCGLGDVQGLCGANCRHSYGAGDGEHNPYEHFDTEENRKEYDLSQKQRQLERRIRASKRETMGLKTALDNVKTPEERAAFQADYDKAARKLTKQNKAYNDFCKEHDRKKRYERTTIAGWDRKQAAAASGAARSSHKKWLKSIGADNTELNTVDKYLTAKYNKSEEYILLNGYNKAVAKGDISPLAGFDQYKSIAKDVSERVVGITTQNGIQINSYTTHFIDRIIGQTSEPHSGMRLGVSVDNALDALVTPIEISEIVIMPTGDKRQRFSGEKASVVVSVTDNRIIQTNPRGEKRND